MQAVRPASARSPIPIARPASSARAPAVSITFENAYRDLFIHNKRATHPLTLLRIIGSSAAAHVGIEFGVKGPTFATCSACSTATHAIGIARDYIRNGVVDVAIAGASESVINYGTMKAWQALHVLSPQGCFPFAKKRNGTVLGEGAGILVLESLEHAKARGANDPGRARRLRHGIRQPRTWSSRPSRAPARPCAWRSRMPALQPAEIDYLNAHGTATADQRQQRDQRHQGRVRRARLQAGDLVDQVDARASARRRRRHRGRRLHQGDARRMGAADDRPRRAGSRVRPRLRAQRRPRQEGHATRCRTRSPSAASTPCWCSARRRPDRQIDRFARSFEGCVGFRELAFA